MGKRPRSAQNGEVANDAVLSHDAAAPGRQRPEEILAQTLTAPRHVEATDAWSARGRRLFLVALALAGAILVAAGLLITGELGPGPGQSSPLSTGPGNGVADQLLRPITQEATTATTASAALPLPATATTHPAGGSTPRQLPGVTPTPVTTVPNSPPPTTPPQQQSPTTTLPCGLLGQGLQSAQVPLPCQAPTVGARR